MENVQLKKQLNEYEMNMQILNIRLDYANEKLHQYEKREMDPS